MGIEKLLFLGIKDPITYRSGISLENYAWMSPWIGIDYISRKEMAIILKAIAVLLDAKVDKSGATSAQGLEAMTAPNTGIVASIGEENIAAMGYSLSGQPPLDSLIKV